MKNIEHHIADVISGFFEDSITLVDRSQAEALAKVVVNEVREYLKEAWEARYDTKL